MNKNLKRVISVILIMTIVACLPIFVFAESRNTEDGEKYAVIGVYNASISISGLTAECTASLTAKYSTSLSISMTLQKSTSNGYTNVKTWAQSGSGTYLDLSKSKIINPLNTYRLKVTFTAGGESVTVYRYA